jgi:predicted AAA+ superfamily ATPase
LDKAKVIQIIYPTTNVETPVIPDIRKFPKLQFLDTGLVNHLLKIQSQLIGLNDLSKAYKGKIIPQIITQELISLNDFSYHKPNFWIRDKKQSSAEVDLVYTFKDKVIPIEIKSGKTGTLKSLQLFINECPHHYAVRIYAGQFKIENQKTLNGKPYLLMNMPYYLGTKIPEYISYFVDNYQL